MPTETRALAPPLDPTVKALGVVTLLNDLSSEVAVRTLPLFLANVLGVRAGIIGLIEGLAESTATLLKVVSGVLADRVGKKRLWRSGGMACRASPSRCCSSPPAGRWCWWSACSTGSAKASARRLAMP
jgi:hypothetical protein